MNNFSDNLGVQSYCFRNFKDNKVVAKMVRELGLNKIELCGVHIDFLDVGKFKDVISIYKNEGVEIYSIGVQYFSKNEANERKYFEFVKMCGAKYISADFDINKIFDCFRVAEKLADEYDVKIAIHNHGGWHWLGNIQTLEYVFKNTSERIGLCLDTAWALDSRIEPIKMIETFSKRLYSLHLKDFIFERDRKVVDVVLGEGNIDIGKIVNKLKDINFSGPLIIEYEGEPENPVPSIKKGIENFRKALKL
ncbi:MAG: sugar phosphate isomerase/epimerase [Candidatus Omnitrophica bacterium]|nr:sugar phosphate isomerase/epimerase [Candidatus Omnitrophota bacterium]MCM8801972.1 sugar phosphate isomerase/epimerase [Candidatus Omnitrophota bacterium]